MFNLDHAIDEWRRQMSAGGIKAESVLDELESHLREDVERQMRSGADAEKAFETAVKKIGAASELRKEFKKSSVGGITEKLMIATASLVVAFGAFLSIVTLLLCYRTVSERLMGFVAIGLTFGTACGWPAFVSRLPVIHPGRKLQAMQVLCLLAGFGISTFYVQLILPHFEHSADRIIPPIGFLGIFPIAVGLAVAAGLDRAARGTGEQIVA